MISATVCRDKMKIYTKMVEDELKRAERDVKQISDRLSRQSAINADLAQRVIEAQARQSTQLCSALVSQQQQPRHEVQQEQQEQREQIQLPIQGDGIAMQQPQSVAEESVACPEPSVHVPSQSTQDLEALLQIICPALMDAPTGAEISDRNEVEEQQLLFPQL